ncbi:MAG: hypothetical protein QGG09_06115, partial [Pirellulaceae bacterium]|nr:hypothetical protein [Pirellulaceae bacterium]
QTFGEVDPKDPLNQTIVNLDAAPKNFRGKVQYQTDLCILKPVDMRRGNGKIIFEPPNRGNKRILTFLNDAPESNNPATLEHAGNAFLMRQGYTIVWAGWQGDVCPGERRLTMEVPIATRKEKEIVALTRTEMVAMEESTSILWARVIRGIISKENNEAPVSATSLAAAGSPCGSQVPRTTPPAFIRGKSSRPAF